MATTSPGEYVILGMRISLKLLQDVADGLPASASIIVNLVQRVVTMADDIRRHPEDTALLRDNLLQLLPVVVTAIQEATKGKKDAEIPADLERNINHLQCNLERILDDVTKIKNVTNSRRRRDKLASFIKSGSYADTLQRCRADLDWAMQEFNVATRLTNSIRICEIFRNKSLLKFLPRAERASSTCARPDRPGGCFQGTRIGILGDIKTWIVNPDRTIPRCFWLNGVAGVGKTTVAYSVVELAQSLGILGVDFFFSRLGEEQLRDPALVFPTIAYQLALVDPEFSRVITTALASHPGAGFSSLKNQLDTLIIEPLSKVKLGPNRTVALVLDAFDECEAKGAREILQLLVAALPLLPFFLKIFITSRPDEHIRSVLVHSNDIRVADLYDIEDSVVKADIEVFLRGRLRNLPNELGHDDLDENWVTEAEIRLLANAAGTFFLYAATVLRFLMGKLGPRKQLGFLLKFIQSPRYAPHINPLVSLDELYLQVLPGIFDEITGAEVAELFRIVVGSMVLLRDPLPVRALERMTDLDDDGATELLNNLHSVILPPGCPPHDCPHIYHPFFSEFLLDHSRCSDDRLWIDVSLHESRLALRCLEVMNASLHKNMLGEFDSCPLNSEVEDLRARIENTCSSELRYACHHWASHLVVVPHGADERIRGALDIFASRSMLPWLELLSWLGQMRLAIPSLEAANAWAVKSTCSETTVSLLIDGYRLVLAHFPILSRSALHLARSVLPFTPRNIQLSSTYANYADSNIKFVDGADLQWPACSMIVKGHTNDINSIAVCPDGTRIVSASSDKTVRIWSASNGDAIAVLSGHTNRVTSVAFSPDGDRIVSGSDDQTVRLWNVTTGREVSTLEGHNRQVFSVSFSPDGAHIASGSRDKTVRIWDVATSRSLFTLEAHSRDVFPVAYFPDARRLASGGSSDHTIRVWDLADRTCVAKMEGHSMTVLAVAISPDGLQIVSGSRDETIRIWEASTGTAIRILRHHTDAITAVAFSPDGSHIVSGSDDKTVRLWGASAHSLIATYHGHTDRVTSVVFSRDGRHLVSGSMDQSIRVWHVGAAQGDATNYSADLEDIVSLTFSSDGSRLAIMTLDGTEGLMVHVRDSAKPPGELLSFRVISDESFRWNSRIQFIAGDTELAITSSSRTIVHNASDGNPVTKEVADLNRRRSPPPFMLKDGNIVREEAPSRVVCFLPKSLQVNDIACSKLRGGAGHLILAGCRGGRIFTLHVT